MSAAIDVKVEEELEAALGDCLQKEIGATLKESFMKLSYMDRRDMKAIYLSEVIVRNVKSDLERYEPSLKNNRWPYKALN